MTLVNSSMLNPTDMVNTYNNLKEAWLNLGELNNELRRLERKLKRQFPQ